jgi:hypothetical protein
MTEEEKLKKTVGGRGPCPVSDWDEDQAYAELVDLAETDLKENAAVRAFLSEGESDHKIITFQFGKDTVDLKVHAVVPYEVRMKIAEQQKLVGTLLKESDPVSEEISKFLSLSLAEMQQPMYEILALYCVEEPFTDWMTWLYIDQKTGRAPYILQQINKELEAVEKNIRKFR